MAISSNSTADNHSPPPSGRKTLKLGLTTKASPPQIHSAPEASWAPHRRKSRPASVDLVELFSGPEMADAQHRQREQVSKNWGRVDVGLYKKEERDGMYRSVISRATDQVLWPDLELSASTSPLLAVKKAFKHVRTPSASSTTSLHETTTTSNSTSNTIKTTPMDDIALTILSQTSLPLRIRTPPPLSSISATPPLPPTTTTTAKKMPRTRPLPDLRPPARLPPGLPVSAPQTTANGLSLHKPSTVEAPKKPMPTVLVKDKTRDAVYVETLVDAAARARVKIGMEQDRRRAKVVSGGKMGWEQIPLNWDLTLILDSPPTATSFTDASTIEALRFHAEDSNEVWLYWDETLERNANKKIVKGGEEGTEKLAKVFFGGFRQMEHTRISREIEEKLMQGEPLEGWSEE